jgi:hypothetical protein
VTATIHTLPVAPAPTSPGALATVRHYFTTIHPARGHGKTDCGEYLDGSGALPDGDHFLAWLAAEGFMVVRSSAGETRK